MVDTGAATAAAERSKTWWLLSGLLLEQPSAPSLRALLAALSAATPKTPALVDLQRATQAALAAPQALVDLQVEYTRLLRGIDRSHEVTEPYESLAREGQLCGATTEAVAAAYRAAGFADIAPEAGPPDHAGTELRFLALLGFEEMKAWQAGDTSAAEAWQARQARFIDEHVAQWLPAHCGRLRDAASTAFYRAVATIVADACTAERDALAAP